MSKVILDENPYDRANFLSRILYLWLTPLIKLGYTRPLEQDDIYTLPKTCSCVYIKKRFDACWKEEKKYNPKPAVGKVLFRVFGYEVLFSILAFIPFIVIMLIQPFFVNGILQYVSGNDYEFWGLTSGISFALLLGGSAFFSTVSFNSQFYFLSQAGIKAKVAVITAVFTKSLKLSSTSRAKHNSGEMVTLISVDSERLWMAVLFLNWLWLGPLMVILAMVLLYFEVGFSAIVGLIVMLIFSYSQEKIGGWLGKARAAQMKFTDARTKMINESLQGIRIVKMYAWEEPTAKRIFELREKEVDHLTTFHSLKMFNTAAVFIGPLLVSFVLFTTFVYTGGELTVPKVYTVLALLNVIRLPFALTPLAWAAANEAFVSLKRITYFLNLEETTIPILLDGDNRDERDKNHSNLEIKEENSQRKLFLFDGAINQTNFNMVNPLSGPTKKPLLTLTDCDFSWSSSDKVDPVLQEINLSIFPGDFIAIVGSVGSGKSSLVSAILGQLVLKHGVAENLGDLKVAFVSQEHWIRNVSLQENVLFDSIMMEEYYAEALDGAQLSKDLVVLPHADLTSIGERGINLSGGQKARVSVARALYSGLIAGKHLNNSSIMNMDKTLNSVKTKLNLSPQDTSGESPTSVREKKSIYTGFKKPEDEVLISGKEDEKGIDLYIFDDSLASVDVHVGRGMFEGAFQGLLKGKTRIVVLSSNYHLLHHFSKIIVMENGQISANGTFSEIVQKFPKYDPSNLSRRGVNLWDSALDEEGFNELTSEEKEGFDGISRVNKELTPENKKKSEEVLTLIGGEKRVRRVSTSPGTIKGSPSAGQLGHQYWSKLPEIESRRKEQEELMTEEERDKGAVTIGSYLRYFSVPTKSVEFFSNTLELEKPDKNDENLQNDQLGETSLQNKPLVGLWNMDGALLLLGILSIFAFSQGTRVMSELWMGIWAENEEKENPDQSTEFYFIFFAAFTFGTIILTIIRSYWFILTCLRASRNLHHKLLNAVLAAPVNTYFDVTPIGRILNRFSKDLDNMDSLLPDFFLQTLQNCFHVAAIAVICIISSPYFILLFIPIVILFYFIQLFFRKSSREMKRMDSITRSPVYSFFDETLQGMMTIHAFKKSHLFQLKFFSRVNQHMRNFFTFWMASRWLALRLDVVSNLIILTVALLGVLLSDLGSIDPSLLGIALVYALQLTGLLQWTVRVTVETETNMTSVERLLAFSRIHREKNLLPFEIETTRDTIYPGSTSSATATSSPKGDIELGDLKYSLIPTEKTGEEGVPPGEWPSSGEVVLSNLRLRYRPELPLVLHGVNLLIPGGKKVGFCGRTAAGKSSLMLSLLRLVEAEEGSAVEIDGIDIRSVGLKTLRSRVTIIPQDPFMFSGTLRYNLDPFEMYTDEQIWEALDRAHLKTDVIEKFPDQLQHEVAERGENISTGQRQLVCIARALLRNSKVIIMDEATASVDSTTDQLIQQTMREEFKNCTVLTIAHRLETIADYDLVAVLENGLVVEYGTPLFLLGEETAERARMARVKMSSQGKFLGFVDELGEERKRQFIEAAKAAKPKKLSKKTSSVRFSENVHILGEENKLPEESIYGVNSVRFEENVGEMGETIDAGKSSSLKGLFQSINDDEL